MGPSVLWMTVASLLGRLVWRWSGDGSESLARRKGRAREIGSQRGWNVTIILCG